MSRVAKPSAGGGAAAAAHKDESARVAALTQEEHENEPLSPAASPPLQQQATPPEEDSLAAAAKMHQYSHEQKTLKLFIAIGLVITIFCAICTVWFYIMLLPMVILGCVALVGVMKPHRKTRWALIVLSAIFATIYLLLSILLILLARGIVYINPPYNWFRLKLILKSAAIASIEGICSAVILLVVTYVSFRLNSSYKKEIEEEAERQYLLDAPVEVKEIIV